MSTVIGDEEFTPENIEKYRELFRYVEKTGHIDPLIIPYGSLRPQMIEDAVKNARPILFMGDAHLGHDITTCITLNGANRSIDHGDFKLVQLKSRSAGLSNTTIQTMIETLCEHQPVVHKDSKRPRKNYSKFITSKINNRKKK